MKIRLQELSQGRTDLSYELDTETLVEAVKAADELYDAQGRTMQVQLEVERFDRTLTARGRLQGEITYECARCLAEQKKGVDLPFRWTLLPREALTADHLTDDEEVQLTEDDLEVSFYENDEIEIGELVRETLILELDAAPTCELDSCENAAYLAAPAEEADSERTDPRWAALAAIKERMNQE